MTHWMNCPSRGCHAANRIANKVCRDCGKPINR